MQKCKNCGSVHAVRNGKVRGKQRYRCKECGFNFVEGDARTNEKITAKKAMLILFYSLGKASFTFQHCCPGNVVKKSCTTSCDRDPSSGKRYTFLTNHFRLSAQTIADVYRERWHIELFFKEIKQNLRIKTFVGNTENAVLIQIYTALTIYLLLKYQKFLSHLGLSVQQLFQLIQINLFGEASLEELLSPRRRKIENPYNLSLLNLAA